MAPIKVQLSVYDQREPFLHRKERVVGVVVWDHPLFIPLKVRKQHTGITVSDVSYNLLTRIGDMTKVYSNDKPIPKT